MFVSGVQESDSIPYITQHEKCPLKNIVVCFVFKKRLLYQSFGALSLIGLNVAQNFPGGTLIRYSQVSRRDEVNKALTPQLASANPGKLESKKKKKKSQWF